MSAADDRLWELDQQERRELAGLLHELSADEWEAPSLCAGWRVRDVAAHQLLDEPVRELGLPGFVTRLARLRLDIDRANEWWVAHCSTRSTDELLAAWDRSLARRPHPVMRRALGPAAFLRGSLIHQQDIRRPLGRPRVIPADRLATVLDLVLTPGGSANLGSHRRAEGLRLRATDLDWSRGMGPEVAGPGEAILLALAGRPAALSDLDGPGLPTFADRVMVG